MPNRVSGGIRLIDVLCRRYIAIGGAIDQTADKCSDRSNGLRIARAAGRFDSYGLRKVGIGGSACLRRMRMGRSMNGRFMGREMARALEVNRRVDPATDLNADH